MRDESPASIGNEPTPPVVLIKNIFFTKEWSYKTRAILICIKRNKLYNHRFDYTREDIIMQVRRHIKTWEAYLESIDAV